MEVIVGQGSSTLWLRFFKLSPLRTTDVGLAGADSSEEVITEVAPGVTVGLSFGLDLREERSFLLARRGQFAVRGTGTGAGGGSGGSAAGVLLEAQTGTVVGGVGVTVLVAALVVTGGVVWLRRARGMYTARSGRRSRWGRVGLFCC